ncbi:AIR carboxylase family protein [Candidatus Gottesmanbacteria bacterium]|nr:AIR carboxylase family protein [Candidatus Gottesmanbacteria bacterium]
MKNNNIVVIILGSKSDLTWAQKIAVYLTEFQLDSKIHIASAHKSPKYALELVNSYEKSSKNIIFIAIAGRSNALGGFLDANTHFPVINCPPESNKYGGLDILSSLRMPTGVAPATVLEPDQAALLAAKILALTDANLEEKIKDYHQKLVSQIKNDDKSIQ